jgi:hypothetical protein
MAKTASTGFKDPKIYAWRELESLYAGNGTVRRIIDTLANEMTREWVSLDGDDEQANLFKYLEKLNTQKSFADAIRWANLMGGAIIIMLIDDGRTLIEEVDLKNIKKIEALRVLDLGQLFLEGTDYYSDPADPRFNEPQWYTVRPIMYGIPETPLIYKVHESRVLKIDGATVTQYLKRINKGWMAPVIQSYIWDIINLEQAYSYTSEAMHELIVSVFSINGLAAQMATQDGQAIVKSRLDLINYGKSLVNMLAIDSDNEKFEKVSSNLGGLNELLTCFERKLCAMCGIPHMILFGEQRGGLSSGESGDVRAWYDVLKQKQQQTISPMLNKLLQYISLSEDSEFSGDIADVNINYNALWQYETNDLVDMKLKTAQTDAIYLDRGVLDASEVKTRFINNAFDFDLQIDLEAKDDFDEETINALKEQTEDVPISSSMSTLKMQKKNIKVE